MNAPRLVTIGFSHYCEKARWALDLAGVDYVEDDHVPVFHAPFSRRAGGRRTVPVLRVGGDVFRESGDILRFADGRLSPERRLFPQGGGARAEVEALVNEFDRSLGPATRRLAYFYLLQDAPRAKALIAGTGPAWERRLAPSLFRPMRLLMRAAMNITPEGAARSHEKIDATFASVAERLSDGRRYLVGDRFSAADLTFASLAAPVLLPPEYGHPLPPPSELPAELAGLAEQLRATPAGRFVLRLYAEERPAVRGRGPRAVAS
ncbi:MAG TPA: glutathione S-transferase family protein [Polyangiaceae bacterium]|nr:glutathione S-transferase family protein [Polyangiaceae bacterium]